MVTATVANKRCRWVVVLSLFRVSRSVRSFWSFFSSNGTTANWEFGKERETWNRISAWNYLHDWCVTGSSGNLPSHKILMLEYTDLLLSYKLQLVEADSSHKNKNHVVNK